MKDAYRIALLVTLALTVVVGCDDDDGGTTGNRTVFGNGTIVSEDRLVSGFSAVTHASEGNLHITLGAEEALRIEADENLLQHLITQVQGGVLEIQTESNIDIVPTQAIEFFLTVVELDSVVLAGVGDIDLPNLTVDQLLLTISGVGSIEVPALTANQLSLTLAGVSVDGIECSDLDAVELQAVLSGVGDIRCAGQVDVQTVTVSGVGSYEAPSLASREATLTVGDSGSASVNVSERLVATVTGNGSVTYIDSSGGGLVVECTPPSGCSQAP
ncbi:MAG: DUF2807 domain-containing protein [Gemmatimonadota bacterium]|nr:MAG: DUF2807 domain-containing protein [Gemmatimonadota bacterium]